MSLKNIGIITSGGDCGGLNAVIKGASYMALQHGIRPLIIPNGYAGLYNLVDIPALTEMTVARLEQFHVYDAGSEAGHSRVKVSKINDDKKWERIKSGLKKFSIDALVISGGDDTGSVIVDLTAQGITCVHAPKTMDLDLVPYSVGGDSTINRIAGFLKDIRTTGVTHNRVIVMEVFGRYAGHTAFRGGVAGEADAILIPEVPVSFDLLYAHFKMTYCRRIAASDVKAGTYMVVVAEGLKDASGSELYDESAGIDSFGHKKLAGSGKYVTQEIQKRLKADADMTAFMKREGLFVQGLNDLPEVRTITPSHLVRSGNSSAYDVNFGMQAGAGAVELLVKGIAGVTVVDYKDGKISYLPTKEAIKQRHVSLGDVALYEQLGITFGRTPVSARPSLSESTPTVDRLY